MHGDGSAATGPPPEAVRSYRGSRSIRTRLVVGTIAILLLIVTALTLFIARAASSMMRSQTEQSMSQLVDQGAQSLVDFLDVRRAMMRIWASDSLILSVAQDPALSAVFLPGMAHYLGNYMRNEAWIVDIVLVVENQLRFTYSGDATVLEDADLGAFLVAQDAAVVGLFEQQGDARLALLGPLVEAGRPLESGGYFVLILDLERIRAELFDALRPSPNGFVTIVGPPGPLAFHDVSVTDSEVSRAFVDALGDGAIATAGMHEHDTILAYRQDAGMSGLAVVGVAALADLLAPVRQLVMIAGGTGLVAIGLGIVLIVYYLDRVTAPIRRLTRSARRMAQSDEAAIELGPSQPVIDAPGVGAAARGDEVGELASLFVQLKQKSTELQTANELLAQRNADLNLTRRSLAANLGRLERELEAARQLQMSLVPTTFPEPTAARPIRIAAKIEPAKQVGGDLYDFFFDQAGAFWFVIADVSDKGTSSALFMARARGLIRLAITQWLDATGRMHSPGGVLAAVNEELCQNNMARMFVTLYLGRLDPASGAVVYANAGHPSPLRVAVAATVPVSTTAPDLPLGIRAGVAFAEHAFTLARGETLLLFTDGITEALNGKGEAFGRPRLTGVLDQHGGADPATLVGAVEATLADFVAGTEPYDDMTLLAFCWDPEAVQPQPGAAA